MKELIERLRDGKTVPLMEERIGGGDAIERLTAALNKYSEDDLLCAKDAENAALRDDAERYRWLNEKCTDADWDCLKYESDNWRNAYIDAVIAGETK